MSNVQIISSGKYIPKIKITNEELEKKYQVEENYIIKRTGIKQRFYAEEKIEELAIKACKEALKNIKEKIDLIIVASISEIKQMPSISYDIQKCFNIEDCMCLDLLAGCAGFINAIDIAKLYIDSGRINTALVVGIVIKKCEKQKLYDSYIESKGQKGEILTFSSDEKIYMDGKEVYKYAVTDTVKNINKLLDKNKINLDDIKYIIPHQSNRRILSSMSNKLKIQKEKMYSNVEEYGNTFCASIPIAIDDMANQGLLKENDKVLLIGYGGGLNTGSILLEI